jgi:hypothetical protein
LKKGDALMPLLFNFSLEYTIRRVQVNQDSLKLNGTHQILVYGDDVNILGGSVHTMEKNTDPLVVASNGTGLEENADKSQYMTRSPDQNAEPNHTKKTDDNRF